MLASKPYRLGVVTSALALALAGTSASVAAQGVPQRPSTPGGALRPANAQAPATPPVAPAISRAATPISQPVIQSVPSNDGRALDAALGRLARDPRDILALIDAGNAALAMGDVDAATGFFRRADQVSPGNPRVKAGLAGAMVRNGDPFGAIPLFDEAEKAGAMDTALAADRGLAYDLVGDNATAQRFYRQSLARTPNDEVSRRLALSLAIAGDKHNAEMILSPMVQQRNLAAWRTRAFALAILGQTEEAVGIANTILPADLAASIAPYLRYMPRLTHAQQAAAANFGMFPRASEIGRDDPRVAQYAPKGSALAAADAALTPQGEPLGRKKRGRDKGRTASAAASPAATAKLAGTAPVRVAPPEPQPGRELVTPAPAAPTAAAPARPTTVAMAPLPAPAPVTVPPWAIATPQRTAPSMQGVSPGFSITSTASATPAPAAPTPVPAAPPRSSAPASPPPAAPASPPPAPPAVSPAPVSAPPPLPTPAPAPRNLSDAFSDFVRPSTDATPAAGAVDLRRIKPATPQAKKPAEPPPPSHPSRIWVQVATGRDKAALGFDWRRLTREKAEVLRGKTAYVSAWGQTNRLLTGPFQSEAAANSFIAQLRKADVDGAFVWTSPAGQVVDALGAAPAKPARR